MRSSGFPFFLFLCLSPSLVCRRPATPRGSPASFMEGPGDKQSKSNQSVKSSSQSINQPTRLQIFRGPLCLSFFSLNAVPCANRMHATLNVNMKGKAV